MAEPLSRSYSPKTHKKCIKCRAWKPRKDIIDDETGEVLEKHGFGDHNSVDGLQSICFSCKNAASAKSRERNVVARIRHHTATRCLTQLAGHIPEGFTTELETYLGYKIRKLVRHLSADLKEREGSKRKLRDALNEGYHIDHIRPLSLYNVVSGAGVDWEEFRRCWAIENLTAIPALENLQKGAKYAEEEGTEESQQAQEEEKDVTADV